MDTIVHDFRIAARTLRKSPAFAAAVIATLVIGIGATTAVFTVFDAVLVRPLAYPGAERLVRIYSETPKPVLRRSPPIS